MTYPLTARRRSTPVRLTLSSQLGHDIDGAWWPRTDRIAGELPDLIELLNARLGDIGGININWPPLQRPPDLNWYGWQHKDQHVMTIEGQTADANVLIVPYATNNALATMVLRLAADLPIKLADQETSPFRVAGAIIGAARQQRGGALRAKSTS